MDQKINEMQPPTIFPSLCSLHEAFIQQEQQTADSVIKEVSVGS